MRSLHALNTLSHSTPSSHSSPAASSSPAVLQASARAHVGVRTSKLLPTLEAMFPLCTDVHGTVALLSMVSELHPSGGFLTGASTQEESLCLRTTLYASLHDSFYRLPECRAV
ncbi:hypothetical protein B0H17DRAFT_1212523 [Mycena rosella]|uniref:Microbial-type PARG catalytic domain-containing protein n=1 Tax=Mycena rosella TaxID=1033263 RepID=A0AAD7G2E3_MYCRO|nr:hypothetical protein B0H17DRAFT_1212523 [Mycena rosella]